MLKTRLLRIILGSYRRRRSFRIFDGVPEISAAHEFLLVKI